MIYWLLLAYEIIQWGIRLAMIPVILRRRMETSSALAWLLIISIEPVIGWVLYLLVGSRRLGRKRTRLHRQVVVDSRKGPRMAAQLKHVVDPEVNPVATPIITQFERYTGMPILGGNAVELIDETDAMIGRLIDDINAAKHHVHMVFYIFANDSTGRRVAEALGQAAQRGVECRLLVDHAGSRPFFRSNGLATWLRKRNVEVHPALPVNLLRAGFHRIDLRNHRKLVVIDGTLGYSGSQNIVDADYGHRRAAPWHDLTARFRGPVVSQLQTVFLEDWAFETDRLLEDDAYYPPQASRGDTIAQAVPSGPDDALIERTSPRSLLMALNQAQRRIIMTTPYLIPDEPTLTAIGLAADRGVKIDIVVPQRGDQILPQTAGRYYFDPLLDDGVNIHLHQHGLLHAKTMTIDDGFAFVGSSNFDRRSFYLNFELTVVMYGHQITSMLRFAQMRYINESIRLEPKEWFARPAWRRYSQAAAALLSPLL